METFFFVGGYDDEFDVKPTNIMAISGNANIKTTNIMVNNNNYITTATSLTTKHNTNTAYKITKHDNHQQQH